MNDISNRNQAVELLQQLGLKEYEAKSFVALTRRQSGTAKDISETSDVPRTRVYDAVRVLETKGLVHTQHANPKVFRAVSIEEAVTTLQAEYEDRVTSLRDALVDLEPVENSVEDVTHEVWALSGDRGITSRAEQLIDGADEEVVIVIGHESVFTGQLADHLRRARDRDVDVVVGAVSDELQGSIADRLPDVEVFVSGLEWLSGSTFPDDDTEISRLLMVDREAILVSSYVGAAGRRTDEKAVFGRGFDNGLVTVVRRLMATGLLPTNDPEVAGS